MYSCVVQVHGMDSCRSSFTSGHFFSSDVTLCSMTLHGYSLLTWKNPGGEWAPQKSAALFIFSSSYCPTWCILWTTFYDKHILKSLAAHSICSRTETKGVKLQVSSSVRKEISDLSLAPVVVLLPCVCSRGL